MTGDKKVRVKKEPVDKPSKAKPKSPVEATVVIPETPVSEKRKSNEEDASNRSSDSNKKVKVSIVLYPGAITYNSVQLIFLFYIKFASSWTILWS